MTHATDPGAPRVEPGLPFTRRELRRSRTADPAAVEPSDLPFGAADPGATPAAALPPTGGGFGTVSGLFAAPSRSRTVSPVPTILTVCTGNICRSPMAEALLRARLADLGLRVHSAGTHALVGTTMTSPAQSLALAHGADVATTETHRGRLLTEALLDDADLILTMTSRQREDAVGLLPRRLHRTFPVREFARLAASLSDERIRAIADAQGDDRRARLVALVEAVSAQRGALPAASEDEDVIDPYRRSSAVYEQSAAQLLPGLDEVERVVRAALG